MRAVVVVRRQPGWGRSLGAVHAVGPAADIYKFCPPGLAHFVSASLPEKPLGRRVGVRSSTCGREMGAGGAEGLPSMPAGLTIAHAARLLHLQ